MGSVRLDSPRLSANVECPRIPGQYNWPAQYNWMEGLTQIFNQLQQKIDNLIKSQENESRRLDMRIAKEVEVMANIRQRLSNLFLKMDEIEEKEASFQRHTTEMINRTTKLKELLEKTEQQIQDNSKKIQELQESSRRKAQEEENLEQFKIQAEEQIVAIEALRKEVSSIMEKKSYSTKKQSKKKDSISTEKTKTFLELIQSFFRKIGNWFRFSS